MLIFPVGGAHLFRIDRKDCLHTRAAILFLLSLANCVFLILTWLNVSTIFLHGF